MAKIISMKKSILIGFTSLILGIFFLFIPSIMMNLLKNNSAYFKYEFFIILGFFLIIGAISAIIIGFIDIKREKNSQGIIPRKSFLHKVFSIILIFTGIILILIFPMFALFSEGGWGVGVMAISTLFSGIILLAIGIKLRLRK